jgi:dTDP-4-dehydrorhamnose reductase
MLTDSLRESWEVKAPVDQITSPTLNTNLAQMLIEAGERNLTGIYPLESPGGWSLIGRTPLTLFDHQKNPPAIFRAGDLVSFVSIDRSTFDATRSTSTLSRHESS